MPLFRGLLITGLLMLGVAGTTWAEGKEHADPLNALSDDVRAIADGSRNYLVRVIRPSEHLGAGPERVIGSGVSLTGGYILTCASVVGPAHNVLIVAADGDTIPARVVGADWRTNVAVLESAGLSLPAAPVLDQAILFPGDFIVAVGWGRPGGPKAAFGSVTLVNGVNLGYSDVSMIEAACPLFPGFTGGVALNRNGEAVGLIAGRTALDPDQAILPPGAHLLSGYVQDTFLATTAPSVITLALPMAHALEIAADIIRLGHVERGYLGVQVEMTEVVEGRGPRMKGVLLHQLVDNGPADAAGLIPGDVILEYAGARVESPQDLSFLVNATRPGSSVPLRYLRRGQKGFAYVFIEQAPDLGWSPEADRALFNTPDETGLAPRVR